MQFYLKHEIAQGEIRQNIHQSWRYLACMRGEIAQGEITQGDIVQGDIAQGDIAQGEIRQNIHQSWRCTLNYTAKIKSRLVYIKLYKKNQKSSRVH